MEICESEVAETDQQRDGIVEHRRGLAFDEVDEAALLGLGVGAHVLLVGRESDADCLEPLRGPRGGEAARPLHMLVALSREGAGLGARYLEGEPLPGAGHEV